jgi:hypothetical protein
MNISSTSSPKIEQRWKVQEASLGSIRHGINRHLSDAKDIIHDPDFRQSDKVFSAVTTHLTKDYIYTRAQQSLKV